MTELISHKTLFMGYGNELTLEMDKYIKNPIELFYTYIFEHKSLDKYLIRFPGATRGCIKVDENDIIEEIKLYEDAYELYNDGVEDVFTKYIGMKLVLDNENLVYYNS